ncbi:hypothetical protein BGX29_010192 [Mortierella sp. GBA35]|nr:hypothetical protein BGX23_001209 [Mortierella sp. AD031]KAF9108586.1 hypothetical protein BGX29_010192 [Mortierella sp. GBA35]KAG0202613.1 hypothetical protein BGX33_009565 [Mortierella sp. NVP41]
MFRGASFLLFLNWICIVLWLIASFQSTEASIIVVATNDSYIDRTAAFGPRIPEEGIFVNLIAIETLDPDEERTACRPVTPPDDIIVPWVALVERGGDCSFVDKVRHMEASGAGAVIVGDNVKGGLLVMYSADDTSDIHIPAVFITQNHYRELRYLGMELGHAFLVKMTPDDMNWPVLDVIIFIILSPAFVVLFLYLVWRIRLSQQLAADLAPAEVVSNLPIKVFFTSKLKENDPVECVICLEEFEDEAELRVLPCRHEYHVACIDSWLTKRKKFCPICKRDICAPSETTPLLGAPSGTDTRGDSFNSRPSTRPLPNSHASSSGSGSASAASSAGSSSRSRPQRQPRSASSAIASSAPAGTIQPAAAITSNTTQNQNQERFNTEEDVLRRV